MCIGYKSSLMARKKTYSNEKAYKRKNDVW